jgi:hypothetical protein
MCLCLNNYFFKLIKLKTNFKKEKSEEILESKTNTESITKDLTQEEFEEYISKSGAKGSFMIYRSEKKDDELGLDEL